MCHDEGMPPRFMTLPQVAEDLAISQAQAYALVRSGELPAIQIGGRGQWRVERSKYNNEYIAAAYEKTAAGIRAGLLEEAPAED
jgi:excisionase family DNA binding protein